MSTFKAFFNIIKKNKMTFILAIAINLGITIMYVKTTQNQQESAYADQKSRIAIFNHDQGEVGQALETYLNQQSTVVEVGTSKKEQQDSLFFKEVFYILTIPADFSKEIATGKLGNVEAKAIPNTQEEMQTATLINQFIDKYQFYRETFPEKTISESLKLVQDSLDKEIKLAFATSETDSAKKTATGYSFNLLAYGLFMTILSSVGLVSLSMNKKEIKVRNQCSPLSQRKQSRYFYLATSLFALFSWLLFVGISLILSKADLTSLSTHLFILNSFVFLLAMMSLSVTLAFFIKDHEMLSALNNIVILGTCFISGAFVPQELLSEPVLKIASFFPTYWFVSNNNLIAALETYNQKTLTDYFFNLSILLLFVAVFLLIGFIIRKERGGLKKSSYSA